MSYLSERRERKLAIAKQMRDEHFARTDRIPCLEFDTPVCPICQEHTIAEDGDFMCEICDVWWDSFGRDGEREIP